MTRTLITLLALLAASPAGAASCEKYSLGDKPIVIERSAHTGNSSWGEVRFERKRYLIRIDVTPGTTGGGSISSFPGLSNVPHRWKPGGRKLVGSCTMGEDCGPVDDGPLAGLYLKKDPCP